MMNRSALCRSLKTSVALVGLAVFISCQEENRDLQIYQEKYDSLLQVVDNYRKSQDSLKREFGKRDVINTSIFYGKEYEKIENPEEYIVNSLRSQPELIKLEPVLGGAMEFREIKVLTREWIMALYDDGHIQGRAIYRYELQPDGSVQFEVITSQHPE